jgi:hypothetical protein
MSSDEEAMPELTDFDPVDGIMPASLRSVFIKLPADVPAEPNSGSDEPPMILQGAAALALLAIPFALAIIAPWGMS